MIQRARRIPTVVVLNLLLLLCARTGYAQASPRSDSSRVGEDVDSAKAKQKARKYPTLRTSGYIQVFFKARRDANGDGTAEPSLFRNQRVRLGVKGDVTPHVAYEVEIDPRAPELTGVLRDAFISLDYIPRHEFRIGQQKTLFGYENVISSTRLFVVNRSEVSDNLSRGVNLRDIGLGLLGSFKLSDKLRIEDALSMVNGEGMNVQADSTGTKNLWGRVGLRYRSGDMTVRFGVSAGDGDMRDAGDPAAGEPPSFLTFTRMGADLQVDHPRLFFATEFVSGEDKVEGDPDAGGSAIGHYAIVVGKTRWNAGPLLRYDGLEEYRRWTAGGYLGLPADDVSLLLNYEIVEDDLGKHDDKFYLRLQVRF